MKPISFFVPGIPKPGGSKTATVIRNGSGGIVMRNGRPLVTTRDDAKGNADWKTLVAFFAQQARTGPLLEGAVQVSMTFIMPRPKSHYGKRGLKPSAPKHHTSKPDVLKLARSTEDAMSQIIWKDDNANVMVLASKRYGETPGAEIIVQPVLEHLGATG